MSSSRLFDLPVVIESYWAAANAGQVEAAAACFTGDAVVHDEGRRHAGPAAIAEWVSETTRKYRPVVEPLGVVAAADSHLVMARVSGTFPGSPIELKFEFAVKDGKIARLEVK